MSESKTRDPGTIAKGLGLLALMHVAASGLCMLVSFCADGDVTGGLMLMLFLGGTQIVYVAPAAIVLSSRRRSRTLKGLLIGAAITFLVNAACAGIVLTSIG
jgi:hypothetical protein